MKKFFQKYWTKVLILFSVIGPGIIAANADNDAAGITTYTISGAKYGYSLLFTLFVITFVLGITQEIGARIGVATGKGLGGVIRERFNLRLTMLAMVAMLIANLGVIVADIAGIAEAFSIFGISKYIVVPITVFFLWLILYRGSFDRVEKVFLFMSALYVVYIVTAIYTKPDWMIPLKTLVVPHIQLDKAYLLTMMALIGTTITPWGQFFIQSYVVDKGIHPKRYKYEKLEVFFGAFITDFISFFIIVTAANTLFKNNIVVNDAASAGLSLAPIAGNLAQTLFAFGLLNAGFMGASIVTLATAYALCETFGFESGIDRKWSEAPVFYWLITILLIVGALIVLIPGMPLFTIMIISQSINGFILPLILFYVYIIASDGRIMGKFVNGHLAKIILFIAVGILTVASILTIISSFVL